MKRVRVLVVEDEPEIASLICLYLDRMGFETDVASTGKEAFESVREKQPSLVLLDLLLPDISGLDICKKLKWNDSTSAIPIIIVSALGDESDVISGLELGAEDYVTKPFSPKVLMARVRAVLRRINTPSPSNTISICGGSIVIDHDRHTVTCGGMELQLTATEFGILHYLSLRPGFVRTRDQITQAVHGESVILSGRTIDVHVTSLRKKLGAMAHTIETVRGIGYRLSDTREELDKK